MKENNWKLFLDDIRPLDQNMILARSAEEAISLIKKNGFPSFISFDHDLGEDVLSGKDLVKIIETKVLDGEWSIPLDFSFDVHSDNPVGAENIRVHLNSLLSHLGISFQLERTHPYSSRK